MAETGATAWRWLIAGEFRAFPMRFVLPGLAIAIGVALAFAVHVINRSAAESFGRAVRSAAGGADLQVRGASALGFDESLYPKLMAHSVVADASPVVQLRAIIGEQARPVSLLGLDIFRTQTVSQSLVIRPRLAGIGAGTRSTDLDALLDQDALIIWLMPLSAFSIALHEDHRQFRRPFGVLPWLRRAPDRDAVVPRGSA